MASTIRVCPTSEDRVRGHCRDGIPRCGCVPPPKLSTVSYHSRAEDLTSKKRHAEASQVLVDYAQDVREAVITLVNGNQFSEARRIVSCTPHLLATVMQTWAL